MALLHWPHTSRHVELQTCRNPLSLQLRHTFPQGFFDSNKIHPKQGPFLPRGGLHDVRCPCSIQWIHILNKQRSLKSRLSYDYQTNDFFKRYLGTFEGRRNGYVNILLILWQLKFDCHFFKICIFPIKRINF